MQTFCQVVILVLFGLSTVMDVCMTLSAETLEDRALNFVVRAILGIAVFAVVWGAGGFSQLF